MRTALIGLGRIGWGLHLQRILQTEGYELCAAADTNVDRLKELEEKYNVPGYTDYRDMLRLERPELVVVASPSVFHEEQAIAALQSGANVLLDKPMATNLDAAMRIREAVEKTGRKLVVYQSYRYSDAAMVAKKILKRGILGSIFQIKCTDYDYVRRNDWQAFRELGGGMLYNYGPHQLDLALHLSGDKAKRMFCTVQNIATLGDAEDVVRIVVETEGGVILNVDINQASALPMSPLTLWGKYGTARVENDAEGVRCLHVKFFDPDKLALGQASKELELKERKYPHDNIAWEEEWIPIRPEDRGDFYGECLAYFEGKAEAPVLVDEVIELMRLLEECKKSRK